MTVNFRAQSTAEARRLLASINARLRGFTSFFRLVERVALRPSALQNFAKGFVGERLRRKRATTEARRRRWGYYKQTRAPGVTPTAPPFGMWTGAIFRSLVTFARVSDRSASIDGDASYRGPIKGRKPVTLALLDRMRNPAHVVDASDLERRMEKLLPRWLREQAEKSR